jgi:UDP-glucose 4-epimerase
MTDYFALPVVPTPIGFDGRLQFVHEDDSLEALRLATLGSCEGTINVAGDGVVLLSQAARLAGRPTLPIPPQAGGLARQVLRRRGMVDLSRDQMRFLSYGRGLDTTRMRNLLGLEPRFTTRAAFLDFVRGRRLEGPLSADTVHGVQAALTSLVTGTVR